MTIILVILILILILILIVLVVPGCAPGAPGDYEHRRRRKLAKTAVAFDL